MSRQQELQEVVKGLRQAVPEITGVLVASTDGLSLASDVPEAEAARVAAMAATALGLGKRIASTTALGGLEEVVVRGREGYLVVYAAGDKGVLAVTAPMGANLGLIHLEARQAAARIAQVLA
ncbi:MAG: roadblock/LC7 domain-containing protein [Thermus sp.]|uniref:roadblock/LC7 domain-containing protein n=1 Tax=Thermus sp. TaxID=275 RepID=UPI0026004692|nr:roadblock/LC7 domain-containing protein [Thermus sp.]MCS7219184.1 roadblock/LC7 domain-containing protein [Thermus sp.]MDW8358784.1 roadblock/LC7 domain-containing protein [Thermus sp.]